MSEVSQNLTFEFSSSERRKGETLFRDRAVMFGSLSDTFVSANVRSSTPGRVTLSCEDVGEALISAKCSCAVARKLELCRHVWAALLALEDRGADFLEGKSEIRLATSESMQVDAREHNADNVDTSETGSNSYGRSSSNDAPVFRSGSENEDGLNISRPLSDRKTAFKEKQIAYKEKQKALAKEYRKQQSAKHKELRKQRKQAQASDDLLKEALENSTPRKERTPAFKYPQLVEKARQYFQNNGYEMKQPIGLNELIEARKHLSRVFHPDKGGSHEEILELNKNFQIISDYLKS